MANASQRLKIASGLAIFQSLCSPNILIGPSMQAPVISGSTEASSRAGLHCSGEAHFLACVRPCF